MQVFTDPADIPADFGPSAIAIGKFDGVHSGHQTLLALLRREARDRGIASVVVTFDRNPLALLRPELCPEPLVSNPQKLELLEASGIDATVMLTFDEALASAPARPWAEDLLVRTLGAHLVIAGKDFRFGAKAKGDLALLEELGAEHGFDAVTVEDVQGVGDRRTSSTWIRELLLDGEVGEAAELLGRWPVLRAPVVSGDGRGRELGFRTANLDVSRAEGFIPMPGIYAAWASLAGERHPAAVSIGDNPTFSDVGELRVEAHLLDGEIDAYDRRMTLEFVDFLRPMLRFDEVDALVAQVAADSEQAREILAAAPPHPA